MNATAMPPISNTKTSAEHVPARPPVASRPTASTPKVASQTAARPFEQDAFESGKAGAASSVARPAQTPLQKHVSFFDRDNDGYVTFIETYRGHRRLGVSPLQAVFFSLFINASLGSIVTFKAAHERVANALVGVGFPRAIAGFLGAIAAFLYTLLKWGISLLTLQGPPSISVADIHQGKHGADSEIIRPDGTVDHRRLDVVFQRYDVDHSGALNVEELAAMMHGNAEAGKKAQQGFFSRMFGGLAAKGEFGILMQVAADREEKNSKGETVKALSRETIEKLYDGSLLFAVAAAREADKAARAHLFAKDS